LISCTSFHFFCTTKRGDECAPTQIFQHEYYFRLTGNNIGDPDRLMVQAFTYSKNISLSSLESRRHEQERKREILHPSHLVSAGEPTNNFAFTSRYRVSENTQTERGSYFLGPLHGPPNPVRANNLRDPSLPTGPCKGFSLPSHS
jgi:hypothetical protein